ncbi:TPA: DUF4752 family protein [Escherichia coli]|nr:DUF4752 family protein [Escherichia coli]
MDSFAKYTIIDWIAFLQVLLIWFYMAYRSGQWIVSVAVLIHLKYEKNREDIGLFGI